MLMRLSTMAKVVATLDQARSSSLALGLLRQWPHDEGSCHFVRASANVLFLFTYQGERFALRATPADERGRGQVEAEGALLAWLAGEGLPVAAPVPSHGGAPVETVATGTGTFHATVFPWLAGVQRELEQLDREGFRAWGRALGRLHAALVRCPPALRASRPTWHGQWTEATVHLRSAPAAVQREVERLGAALSVLPESPRHFGLIHGDFELDNLAWQGNDIGMFDFDDCHHSWFVADIVLALRDLFATGADDGHPRFRAFIGGYAEEYPPDPELAERIPIYLHHARLLEYAAIARARDLPADTPGPDWLLALDGKLATRMQAYERSLER